jgi:hypothetical protein
MEMVLTAGVTGRERMLTPPIGTWFYSTKCRNGTNYRNATLCAESVLFLQHTESHTFFQFPNNFATWSTQSVALSKLHTVRHPIIVGQRLTIYCIDLLPQWWHVTTWPMADNCVKRNSLLVSTLPVSKSQIRGVEDISHQDNDIYKNI